MTTDSNLNPSSGPSTFPPRTTEVPNHPHVTQPTEAEESVAEKVANRLAHKANKTEQQFDSDNSNLFSK
jgi:hypothetical protein